MQIGERKAHSHECTSDRFTDGSRKFCNQIGRTRDTAELYIMLKTCREKRDGLAVLHIILNQQSYVKRFRNARVELYQTHYYV